MIFGPILLLMALEHNRGAPFKTNDLLRGVMSADWEEFKRQSDRYGLLIVSWAAVLMTGLWVLSGGDLEKLRTHATAATIGLVVAGVAGGICLAVRLISK